jgi:hypothetical protein
MRFFLVSFLIGVSSFLGFYAHAAARLSASDLRQLTTANMVWSLTQPDDVNEVVQQFAVDSTQLLQLADIQPNSTKKLVEGPTKIIRVKGLADTYFMYGSRIVYIKGRTVDQVARAFETTSELPAPAPIEKIANRKEEVLSPNHQLTTFDMRASQSKFVAKVTTVCKGATHSLKISAEHRLVQNKWTNCVDAKDSGKVWYPNGWQSNQIVALKDNSGQDSVGVLVHNLIVIHRHKVGFVTPSESDMFEMGMKASNDTLAGYLKRLKLLY